MSDPLADTPAPEQPTITQEALNALSPESRAAWEASGDWPDPAKVTTTADPEPDDDEPEPVPEPAPDVPPVEAKAPVPTPDKPVSKRQQHINDLERKAKLAEIRANEVEAKLAALESRIAPKEPAAKVEPPAPVVDPRDPEPVEAQFEDYRSFVKAQARWEFRQARREEAAEQAQARRAHAERTEAEAFHTTAQTWIERRDAFAASTPEFSEKALPFLDRIHAGTPIGDVLLESEVGPQMALHLATHPEDAERIARLPPVSALRALGKLEAQFDSPTTSTSASAGPAVKLVTSAPAPPTLLSARTSSAGDAAAVALERGDFLAFEREENRKALAASR